MSADLGQARGWLRTHRRAHLDGVRGVAILLVVVDHFVLKVSTGPARELAGAVGSVGVHVFFALSGYLITGILLRERSATGGVGLRNFYLRRALRILPAFYVALAGIVLLSLLTRTVEVSAAEVVVSGLFLADYSPVPLGWWLGHTWTLAVEEQFYLLWPALLVLLRPRRALVAALVLIVVEPVVRTLTYAGGTGPPDLAAFTCNLHLQADALLMGAALALFAAVRPDQHARVIDRIGRYRLAPVALLGLVANEMVVHLAGLAYQLPVGLSVQGLCIVVVIAAAERPGRTQRCLAVRPLVWLGLISYSLYLWQQVFSAPFWNSGVMADPLACLAFSLAAGLASWHLVERPGLRAKRRFDPTGPTGPIAPPAGTGPDRSARRSRVDRVPGQDLGGSTTGEKCEASPLRAELRVPSVATGTSPASVTRCSTRASSA